MTLACGLLYLNGVGIGQTLDESNLEHKKAAYNSVNHVTSQDFVGTYGISLGRMINHLHNTEVDYKKVNFTTLGRMLKLRLRLKSGKISSAGYGRRMADLMNSVVDNSNNYTLSDTVRVFNGRERNSGSSGSGLLNFPITGLMDF